MSLLKRIEKPSKEVVNFVSDNEKYKIFNTDFKRNKIRFHDDDYDESSFINMIEDYSKKILRFYDFDKHDYNKINQRRFFSLTNAMWSNALNHGPKDKNFNLGLILGENGVCYSINDGGDFFKNELLKHRIENRLRVDYDDIIGSGFNGYIYPYADLISVDTKQGSLYCGVKKENLIKKK